MSNSEVLCLGLGRSVAKRGAVEKRTRYLAYVRKHLGICFPFLLDQSAFNRRLRRLWGGCIVDSRRRRCRCWIADWRLFDVMDGFPLPVAHGARSFHPGSLADMARIGKGGNDRYFYGIRMMMVIPPKRCGHRLDIGLGKRAGALGGRVTLEYTCGDTHVARSDRS